MEQKAFVALVIAMSNWCFHLDIPLQIAIVEAAELSAAARHRALLRLKEVRRSVILSLSNMPACTEAHWMATVRRGGSCACSRIIEGIRVRPARLGEEAVVTSHRFSRAGSRP